MTQCKRTSKEIIKLVRELYILADRWKQEAMQRVPPEYAKRNLHSKYFCLDNEAAGLMSCSEELFDLLTNLPVCTCHEIAENGLIMYVDPNCPEHKKK